MKLFLGSDDSIVLDVEGVAAYLKERTNWEIATTKDKFHILDAAIKPQSNGSLRRTSLNKLGHTDLAIVATRIPYENNYFYHSDSSSFVLTSFYAWEHLTSLPLENGLIYFVVSLLNRELPYNESHKNTTGCLNDFLWDKTGIDAGMRFGGICPACSRSLDTQKLDKSQTELRQTIDRITSDLGNASRANRNILDLWKQRAPTDKANEKDQFDVFLCHNTQDKPDVKAIASRLKKEGIRVWLDEEQLRPGLAWQVTLEEQIKTISTAAVFVGSTGFGPWQDFEMRAFLAEFVRRQCPVIPVILPTADKVPELPIFLRQLTWVDYREDAKAALNHLLWGITGRRVPA